MKKSWIKTILIVVMVLLLVFSLVACNKDDNKDNKPSGNNPNGPVNPNNPNNPNNPDNPDNPNNPNNPNNPDNPTPPVEGSVEPAVYFDRLWKLTSDIGSEKIGDKAEKDLAVEFGLQLAFNTVNIGDQSIYQQVDLGLDVQAVLGRTKERADNTALKVKLYDPTDAKHTEILSLYLLGGDLDSLYIDFGGKHIRLPHNLVSTVWNEFLGNEGALVEKLPDVLNMGFMGGYEKFTSLAELKAYTGKIYIAEDENAEKVNYIEAPLDREALPSEFEFGKYYHKKTSANTIIDGITEAFGDGWNLNTLIGSITKVFGLDLKGLIEGSGKNDDNDQSGSDNPLVSFIEGMLDEIELFDKDGNLNISEVLKSELVGTLFTANFTEANGVKTYKAAIHSDIYGLLAMADGMIDNLIAKDSPSSFNLISNLLDPRNVKENGSEIALSFCEKDNKIQNFTISTRLGGLLTDIETTNSDGEEVNMTVVPEFAITIDHLKIANADDTNKVQINPIDYKTSIALEEQLSFEVSGITIRDIDSLFGGSDDEESATASDETETNDIVFNHRVEIGVQGLIDLVGGRTVEDDDSQGATTAAEEEKNATQLYVYIRVADLKTNETANVIELSYADGKLAAKVDSEIAKSVIGVLNEMFGGTLDVKVNSAYIDLGAILESFGIELNIADLVHDLAVKCIQGILAPAPPTPREQGAAVAANKPQHGTVTKVIAIFKKALKYISTDNDIVVSTDDALETLIEFAEHFQKTSKWTVENCEEYIVNLLNNPPLPVENNDNIGELIGGIIQNFMAEEDEDEQPTTKDYVLQILYLLAQHVSVDGVVPEEGQSEYDAIILAVLHGGLELRADAKDGFHLSVKGTVGKAHITIAEKLEVFDTETRAIPNLYAEYEAAVEAEENVDNWLDLTEAVKNIIENIGSKQPVDPNLEVVQSVTISFDEYGSDEEFNFSSEGGGTFVIWFENTDTAQDFLEVWTQEQFDDIENGYAYLTSEYDQFMFTLEPGGGITLLFIGGNANSDVTVVVAKVNETVEE